MAASILSTEAKPGRTIIAIGPHVWGKGQTARAAYDKARSQGVPTYLKKPHTFVIIDAPADAYVNDMGGVSWTPAGEFDGPDAPVKIGVHVLK